uniref:Probable zinc-ribbon domain-containing protein n=1 Tax=Leersia perrieri TaxID=77586 RepID=A0A0D9WHR5_9ORYZ
MQSEVRMGFGRCPYCRAMIYQNPKAIIFYCSKCRTPIRGKNPEPTDETEYALSKLEILSADTASVFSDEPEEVGVGPERRGGGVDEIRPASRRTRRPSSSASSDWTTTTASTTDSGRSEEAFYTPPMSAPRSPSPAISQEAGAVAAARLMDPAFHSELLHALDNLRSLIITIEQPRPASGAGGGGGRAVTRRDSRLFRRLESQLERALPPEERGSASSTPPPAASSSGVGRPPPAAAPMREEAGGGPCRPVMGGAPFVVCGKCSDLLRTPPPPPPPPASLRRRWETRIRCGGCEEVIELSLPAGIGVGAHAQHQPIRTCSAPLVSDHHRPLLRRLE